MLTYKAYSSDVSYLNRFAIHLKWIYHCNSTLLQKRRSSISILKRENVKKKKKKKEKWGIERLRPLLLISGTAQAQRWDLLPQVLWPHHLIFWQLWWRFPSFNHPSWFLPQFCNREQLFTLYFTLNLLVFTC